MTAQRWRDPEGHEWVTIEPPSEDILLSYPEGTIEIPMVPVVTTPPTLAQSKASLKSAIDTAAEGERRKYITPGSGQAMTYMQKSDEAARFLASTDPDPAAFPLLAAEVGITAPSIGQVAAIVNGAYAQWQVIGAAIEAARLGTKASIDAAETIEAAQAAADAVSWP